MNNFHFTEKKYEETKKTHELVDLYLEGFVEDVAASLINYKEEFAEYSDLRVYSEYISGGEYGESGYKSTLRGEKLETDDFIVLAETFSDFNLIEE